MGIAKTSFRGGYRFRKFKGSPRPDIVDLETPDIVVIPLKQGYGKETQPTVSEGDQVVIGQIIGKDDDSISNPVHASIGGKVKEIKEIDYCDQKVKAVVIEGDGNEETKTLSWANEDFEKLTAEQISDLLYISGVGSLGATGLPTYKKSAGIEPDDVKYIVVSAMQSSPFSIAAGILDQGKLDRFAMGVKILQKFYNAPVYIGISNKENDFADNLRPLLEGQKDIHVGLLKPKYPQEAPEILTETLIGQGIPYGKKPDAIGAVVVDIPTIVAVYEAVALGKNLTHRVVSLGGTGYKDNLSVRIPVGTAVEKIISKWGSDQEGRFVFGNVLVGDKVEADTPVGREVIAVNALEEDRKRRFLFFMRPGFSADSHSRLFISSLLGSAPRHLETNLHGEPRACIQCSYCENVCPRPLLPQVLSRYCEHGLEEEAKKIRLLGCIECGLCTYVCPSKIPVMTNIQKGIAKLKEEGVVE